MINHFFKKTCIAATCAAMPATALAFKEEFEPQNSQFIGGLFSRLAALLDTSTIAFLDGVLVASIFFFIGGVLIWVNAPKTNIPRQMAIALIGVSVLLGSMKGCASMNSQTYLGTSEVEAYRNVEEVKSNGYFESNTD